MLVPVLVLQAGSRSLMKYSMAGRREIGLQRLRRADTSNNEMDFRAQKQRVSVDFAAETLSVLTDLARDDAQTGKERATPEEEWRKGSISAESKRC